MREALEALPGIRGLSVDLDDDRFDVAYDPSRVSVERMLRSVEDAGYAAQTAEPKARPPVPALPPSVRSLLAAANSSGRPLLLEFSGAG